MLIFRLCVMRISGIDVHLMTKKSITSNAYYFYHDGFIKNQRILIQEKRIINNGISFTQRPNTGIF